jgi:CubicO group peptidase (beta-lactamase class C family)
MIAGLLMLMLVACGSQAPGRSMTSATPTVGVSSTAPVPSLGTAIDDYLAHGSVNLAKIRAVLVSQRGNLLAERYYRSDAAEHVEVQSVTKSVISTLVGIALTKGSLTSLDQTVCELFPPAPIDDVEAFRRRDNPSAAHHDGRLDERL